MASNPFDKIKKIPLPFKVAGLVIILLVIFSFYWFGAWSEIDGKVQSLKVEQERLKKTLQEQQAVADNLQTFIQNTQKLEDDLNNALKQLPRDKEIPQLLRDIYTLGKKSGVSFQRFEPQAVRRQSLYSELPIKLQIEGSYHEVAVFFDRIGKMSRIVNISNLDVSLSRSEDNELNLRVNCDAITFMFTGGPG